MKAIFVYTRLAAILAVGGLALNAVSAEAKGGKGGKCVMAGGEATMVTQDLAKFMSEAALKNSIAAHNWKASGAVSTKCDAANGLPHCVSKRRACA
jgi:hypothetical protein